MTDYSQTLVGISPGASFSEPTTGICRTGLAGFHVGRTFADKLSRTQALGLGGPSPVIAIGAPVLPRGVLNPNSRICEKVFASVPFDIRCAARDTAHGSGAALRRAGCDTGVQWVRESRGTPYAGIFPQVLARAGLIEAFPRVFLGVLLPDSTFDDPPAGIRLSWLHERCTEHRAWDRLQGVLAWPDRQLWSAAASSDLYEEERAAIVCAVTAVCVWAGRYVAVGEAKGGYGFLPPWNLWEPWARAGLERNRAAPRQARPVEVWINGRRFDPEQSLPE